MNTFTSKDNITTLAQAAAYKAYLSLMPQIHHKTVNMSQGATSAEPLKSNHPLDHNELITKADELICIHFDGDNGSNNKDKEEARKATRFAADQLFYQLAPKHNNNSDNTSPTNTMDPGQHHSPKESLSSYNIVSANNSGSSSGSGSKYTGVIATQHHDNIPLHPTTTTVDEAIPFERAVPGDAANPNTHSFSIDSIPARVNDSEDSTLASVITSPQEVHRPSLHIGGKHKIQTAILNQGMPVSENTNSDVSSDSDTKCNIDKNEDSLHSNQAMTYDTTPSGSEILDQDKQEDGNDSTVESGDHKCNTVYNKKNKGLSASRDVALAGNSISALGLSGNNGFNRLPQSSSNNNMNDAIEEGVDETKGYKIRNKHSKLAGYIGRKNNKTDLNNNNNKNDDGDQEILKGNSNPEVIKSDFKGQTSSIGLDKLGQNHHSVAEMV